ncbi:bb3-type cytochrome oxidase subunit III [Glaciimonas sp. CA11.2]|uniref:bb3-type cytochrome oxidase subunit III n=1 Tax=Glaciimonas sp. CA11.2 TaxID=3048601 RepID=UPI002AB39CCA|nr:bb3-type cytochrome oxidase subunit III [Glaciimonas sp. CA11.2]MDY7547840.1 bb3-type cytochrome oxidase subunit III [Glaciimonas sp. CA11.2]MEB0163446.1 bb3-type cytochrome oxidase subunit III [Glaciimonas sp. CA11.2]
MSTSHTLKVTRRDSGRMTIRARITRPSTIAAVSVALWVFIGVATALFTLFMAAYVMRMDGSDWSPIVMPWQCWLSTILLLATSLMLHGANKAGRPLTTRKFLVMGGFFGFAFIGCQFWSWHALQANHITPMGNPAGSFFFLLTAMHGAHVLGGLVGWLRTVRFVRFGPVLDSAMFELRWRARLCTRYWDFLLAVWVVLFAALGWLTPEVVRFICGTR